MPGTGGGDSARTDKPVDESRRGLLGLKPSLAWLAPAGLVLYVFLRIPFAIYFERLGSSPEDAGFGYTQLLAQSSVLVFLIAAVAALVSIYAHGMSLTAKGYWHLLLMSISLHRIGAGVGVNNLREMSDEEFESYLRQSESKMAPGAARDKTIKLLRLVRKDLRSTMGKRQRRRTKNTSIRRALEVVTADLTWRWHRFFRLFLLYTVAIFVVALPWLAWAEADRVMRCEPAHQILGLRYGGQKVQILSSTDHKPAFPDRDLLLLGGDSSRYVLFDCRSSTTIRMPAGDAVVLHRPSR